MKTKELNIIMVYDVHHQIFNLGENGTKTHYDPSFNISYAFGSAANVKRNVKEEFSFVSGIPLPVKYYDKPLKEILEGKDKQGGVSTVIDVDNPIVNIFGAWNTRCTIGGNKYDNATVTSAISVSEFAPLHPLLSSLKASCMVNVGDENSQIILTQDSSDKKEKLEYKTPEELLKLVESEGKTLEDCIKIFKNTRPMNFLPKDSANKEANGIYRQIFNIQFKYFGRYKESDISDLTEEIIEECLKNGWTREDGYLCMPKKLKKDYFDYIIDSLFTWDFSSNISLHGARPTRLRTSFTSTNINLWKQATIAEVKHDENGREFAQMKFTDNLEEKGVYSYNTLSLAQYIDNSNKELSEFSIEADDNAIEKLKKLGHQAIEEW